jgi:hypothetical protein
VGHRRTSRSLRAMASQIQLARHHHEPQTGARPPVKRFGITRREVVGNPDCPVMTRWVVAVGGFSIRLHRFCADHEDVHPHSHPWSFVTLVLAGGYDDISMTDGRVDKLRAGSVRLRPSAHRHRTRVGAHGCTTLLLTGCLTNEWGFWVRGRFYPWRLYRHAFPAPPCSPSLAEAEDALERSEEAAMVVASPPRL